MPSVLLVCGEALVDLVAAAPTRAGGAGPAGRAPVVLTARPGGSPANTAVGLGRLGTGCALLSRLADDPFGRLLREHLLASKVDLTLAVAATEPTTLAIATLDDEGRAEYRFYVDGCADGGWSAAELPDPLPVGCDALHVSGALATAVPSMGDALEHLLRREHGRRTISFDPNPRPGLADRAAARTRIERWLVLSTLVKVSADDLGWLYPNEAVAAVARRWATAGPALIVVTHGGDGVAGWLPYAGTPIRLPALPASLVDTVGAGDALASGLLDWLSRNQRLRLREIGGLTLAETTAALTFAQRVAAACCGRRGADPPWRREL